MQFIITHKLSNEAKKLVMQSCVFLENKLYISHQWSYKGTEQEVKLSDVKQKQKIKESQ